MHSALADLMEAEKLLTSNISVEGTFFIEVMAGECIIILGDVKDGAVPIIASAEGLSPYRTRKPIRNL